LPANAVALMLAVHFTDIWRPGSAGRLDGTRLLSLAKVMGDITYVIGPTPAERNQIEDALASEPVTVATYDSAELFFNQVTATTSGCVLVPCDLSGMEILRRGLPLAIVVMGRKADLTIAVELRRHHVGA
jgi:FixJ family two-component response regulator